MIDTEEKCLTESVYIHFEEPLAQLHFPFLSLFPLSISWILSSFPLSGTAVLLMFVSLLYLYQMKSDDPVIFKHLTATYVMYIIVGVEMAVTIPCLVYYFGMFVCLCVHVCMYVCECINFYSINISCCIPQQGVLCSIVRSHRLMSFKILRPLTELQPILLLQLGLGELS